jgi:selenocysteine lyase/cysteine desulfurase
MPPLQTPEELAQRAAHPDEAFWDDVAGLYDLDQTFVQLNFGYYHPALRPVVDAEARAVVEVNRQGSYFKATRSGGLLEDARRLLAIEAGVEPDRVAVVRSSSEAINMVLQGWPLSAGDEVVASTQDYVAVQEVLAQREAWDRIVVRRVEVPEEPGRPVTAADYQALFSDRTRLVVVTDLVHSTGRRMPSLDIIRAAHARNIAVFVDAAHSFGQVDTSGLPQEADFFCTSLHKWVGAPLGTGMLVVAPGALAQLRPLYGDVSHALTDIRRLERLGDRPDAAMVGLIQALKWHAALGWRAKGQRLGDLQRQWSTDLALIPGVTFLSPTPGSSAIGSFRLKGIDAGVLAERLMAQGIYTVAVKTSWGAALRVVVGMATRRTDLDRFTAAVSQVQKTL